ncbi:MAG: hypothetical protein U9R64_04450, partial [Pseudomonadota bacterium]|nr:hypothetical protein [Pseudomonadota bacterium]
RHRLSGPLSGQGYAPPYDQPRQPILPAIIVAAQPAIVVVATQLRQRQLSSFFKPEPVGQQAAHRGHLHARYPFKLLVAGRLLIERIFRRAMGPTKIHQALCRAGSVLRKRGGF